MQTIDQGVLDVPYERTEHQEGSCESVAKARILDELPGAAFALITLVWVIFSFANFMWLAPASKHAIAKSAHTQLAGPQREIAGVVKRSRRPEDNR
jgi:hypothetical protein